MFENLIRRIKGDYYTTDEIKAMINEAHYSDEGEVTIEDFNNLRLALGQIKYRKWGRPTSIDESDIEEFCIKALLRGKPGLTEDDIGTYLDSLLEKNKMRENSEGIPISPLVIFNEFFFSVEFKNNIQQINTQQNMEKFYRVVLKYATYVEKSKSGFGSSALGDQLDRRR